MEEIAKFERERSNQLDGFSGARLDENDFGGVKEIARERRQSGTADVELRMRAIKCVADHGMAQGAEVHTNLMSAASVKLDFQECGGANAGADAPIRTSGARVWKEASAVGGHTGAVIGMAGNGEFDAATIFRKQTFN